MSHTDRYGAVELHVERTDLPNWDTKVRCTCGHEEASRAQLWKHQAEALRAAADKGECVGWVRHCHSHNFDFWRADDGDPPESGNVDMYSACTNTSEWRPVHVSHTEDPGTVR